MNADVKEMWIKALRSGDYEQGVGALRKGDQFCCLGVLCDLHRKRTGRGEWVDGHYLGSGQILPVDVVEWAGLTLPDPFVGLNNDGTLRKLSYFNDDGVSFYKLSEWIERGEVR